MKSVADEQPDSPSLAGEVADMAEEDGADDEHANGNADILLDSWIEGARDAESIEC